MKKFKKIDEEKSKDIVKGILEEYEKRKESRKPYELSWLLNINFMMGNQYSYISPTGKLDTAPKSFFWESREVFNHIAPIMESRLAKLNRVKPSISVRPSGNEEKDIENAKLSKSVLDSVSNSLNLSSIISSATIWSEICGTAFYKVIWDYSLGNILGSNVDSGESVKDGDVSISVCSPFEIFPDSSGSVDIENCKSILHVKSIDAGIAEEIYGIDVVGQTLDTLNFSSQKINLFLSGDSNANKTASEEKENQVLVIEKWEKPTESLPQGHLSIVVGDKLVYDDVMPSGEYPFIKQVSAVTLGSFWGTSIIERCIPLQRSYNAIKNRKIEFLSRLSSGVLAVEDGSVDVDNLEEEGLAPGKILVYRSGSSLPKFMDSGDIPSEFSIEEDRIVSELITLTGVSELMRNSTLPNSVTSGTAINLLMEQDDTRLAVTAENIRHSMLKISKKVISLYKKYAVSEKIAKIVDGNGSVQLFYWSGSDLNSDDIVLDTVNELSETPATRKNMALELLKLGVLTGEDGKLDGRMRAKILEIMGFGNWESSLDITTLNIKRAKNENVSEGDIICLEIDDHKLHIAEHTKFVLENENSMPPNIISKLIEHIRQHKKLLKLSNDFQLSEISNKPISNKVGNL